MTTNRKEGLGPKIIQRDAQALAAGYTQSYRKVEITAIAAFMVLCASLLIQLLFQIQEAWYWILAAFFIGLLSADFVSGLVHWMGDTWGSPEWPYVGPSLIRNFREHHVDQKAITHHDFIELNGNNCLVSIPVLIAVHFVSMKNSGFGVFVVAWAWSLCLWVLATNEIHKWAHRDTNPKWIKWLQTHRWILSTEHHDIHHRAPYISHYCITTGWLNAPLNKIGFYRKSERLITFLTGAIPRKDDIGEDAAALLVEGATRGPELNPQP